MKTSPRWLIHLLIGLGLMGGMLMPGILTGQDGDPTPRVIEVGYTSLPPTIAGHTLAAHPVHGPFYEETLPDGESVLRLPDEPEPGTPLTTGAQAAAEAGWEQETADPSSCVEGQVNMALDRNGRPHIVYYDSCNKYLGYSFRDGKGWYTMHFTLGDDTIGQYNDILVGPDGTPHIIYYDSTSGLLKYTYPNSNWVWQFETIDAALNSGKYCSLAMDSLGRLHVAYFEAVNGALMYRIRDEGVWTYYDISGPYVVDGGYGIHAAITIDQDDWPHIFYSADDRQSDYLYHAWETGPGDWATEIVDTNSGVGGFGDGDISAAVDSLGRLQVSYYDRSNTDLKYAYKDSTGWHRMRIINAGLIGRSNALAVDSAGNPHLSYWNGDYSLLRLASKHGEAAWAYETIYDGADLDAFATGWNEIQLDRYDQPNIAFISEDGNVAVRAAWQPDPAPAALVADTTTSITQSDANRCAYNVASQFNSLRDYGEVMGFHLGSHPEPKYNIDPFDGSDLSEVYWHSHWQGMQRLNVGTGRFLVISQDEIQRKTTCGGSACTRDYSGFALVEMGTRNAAHDRFRSNRLSPWIYFQKTPPNLDDTIFKTIYHSSAETHASGIQAMGNILALGTEVELTEGLGAHLAFFDLGSPAYLPSDQATIPGAEYLLIPSNTGTAVALTRLSDGRYLLASSSTGPKGVDFFISYAPRSLSGANPSKYVRFMPLDWFPAEELSEAPGLSFKHHEWDSYQNINLINECATGKLFLVAFGNRDSTIDTFGFFGDDYADLFEVSMAAGQIHLTRVGQRHFYCSQHLDDTKFCNFDAAAGAYVNASGQLYLYSSEHENDGPYDRAKSGNNSISFMEFRPVPHRSYCPTPDTAWVELYDNTFRDESLGEGLMLDYPDRDLEFTYDYNWAEGFDNQAQSLRWCLPVGHSYYIFQYSDRCSGKVLVLYGSNDLHLISDLDDVGMSSKPSCSLYWEEPQISAGVSPSGQELVYDYIVYKPRAPELSQGPAPDSAPDLQAPSAETSLTTTLDIPAGALSATTMVTFTPSTPLAWPDGQLWTGINGFTLSLNPAAAFQKPVPVTLYYAPDETVYIDPQTLYLGYYDPVQEQWKDASATCGAPVPTVRNLEERRVQTVLCAPGQYALFGRRVYPLYLPVLKSAP